MDNFAGTVSWSWQACLFNQPVVIVIVIVIDIVIAIRRVLGLDRPAYSINLHFKIV